jgi:hypothetical protein
MRLNDPASFNLIDWQTPCQPHADEAKTLKESALQQMMASIVASRLGGRP